MQGKNELRVKIHRSQEDPSAIQDCEIQLGKLVKESLQNKETPNIL